MTGYSNYDNFMNYCEGYRDAYRDAFEDFGIPKDVYRFVSHPKGYGKDLDHMAASTSALSKANDVQSALEGADPGVIARAGKDAYNTELKGYKHGQYMERLNNLAEKLGTSAGNLVRIIGENPGKTAAIAAAAIAAGVGSVVGLRKWLKSRRGR